MLKVLIVDDEPNIREGLKILIDWEKYGFEICGIAENGKKGIEKVKELSPDVCIIDVKMPGINGLEMAEYLYTTNNKTKIIILSGYSDFEYAKKAISFGVKSYILKPIDENELIKSIKDIYNSIITEKKRQKYFAESITLSKNKIIERIITNKNDLLFMNKVNEIYDFKFPWRNYQIALINLNDNKELKDETKNIITEQVKNFVKEKEYGYYFELDNKIGILLKNVIFKNNYLPFENLYKKIIEKNNIEITIVLGKIVHKFDQIYESYKDANELLLNKFIYGDPNILLSKQLNNYKEIENKKPVDTQKTVKVLCAAIDVNNLELINNILEDLMTFMEENKYQEEQIKAIYINIYVTIINELLRKNEELKKSQYINENIFEEINNKQTLRRLHGYVKYQLIFISNELFQKRPNSVMNKILDYINRNYDKQLKLDELAKIFMYSSVYLGKQFREYTGVYFNDYINKVRIDNAKKILINSDFKIYQIAKKIGYKSQDYFCIKFKESEGMSPSMYRKIDR